MMGALRGEVLGRAVSFPHSTGFQPDARLRVAGSSHSTPPLHLSNRLYFLVHEGVLIKVISKCWFLGSVR